MRKQKIPELKGAAQPSSSFWRLGLSVTSSVEP
jgi:hypothetical protein